MILKSNSVFLVLGLYYSLIALILCSPNLDAADKHSTISCNRTANGDSCVITHGCWQSGVMQLFHRDVDEPAAEEEGILPIPTRACHSSGCKFVPFQHIFNNTWRTYGNDIMKRTTYVDHPVYFVFPKPDHPSFPHFFHDFIIPLYETMVRVDGKVDPASQIMLLGPKSDMWNNGVAREMMGVLTAGPVRHLEDVIPSSEGRLCFERAVIGAYSIVGPERYPNSSNPDFWDRVAVVQGFRDHLLKSFQIETQRLSSPSVLLISRQCPRAILNEIELVESLAAAGIQVEVIDPSKHKLREQLLAVRRHWVVAGMTGAGLLLSMFMQTPAAMVAMFPYGTHPHRSLAQCHLGMEHFVFFSLSHTKKLSNGTAKLDGEYITYENSLFEDTYCYWQNPRSLEGHFFKGYRDWVQNFESCQNLWAFNQNQDSIVDHTYITTSILAAIARQKAAKN